jgi:hypothetical protein
MSYRLIALSTSAKRDIISFRDCTSAIVCMVVSLEMRQPRKIKLEKSIM